MAKDKAQQVYMLKVALKGAKRFWRRIAIRGDQTLDDLHGVIYDAFDRYDEHLYSFYFPPAGARGRDRLRHAVEYTHPFNAKDDGMFGDEPLPDASKARIGGLKLRPGQRFEYLFDFGDQWWHEITVEQIDAEIEGPFPRLVEARGKSPPQYPDPDEDESESE